MFIFIKYKELIFLFEMKSNILLSTLAIKCCFFLGFFLKKVYNIFMYPFMLRSYLQITFLLSLIKNSHLEFEFF